MASVNIVIQINGDGNLVPGSREDAEFGDTITLINANNTNVGLWDWTMVGQPTSSSAALSSTGNPTTSFVVDGYGTFLVRLQINNSLSDEIGIGVKTPHLQYRIPGVNEKGQFNVTVGGPATSGWFPALEDALLKLDDGYGSGIFTGGVTSLTAGGGITVSASIGAVTLGSSAGGDISGTVAAATVAKIRNVAVAATSPSEGQVLIYRNTGTTYRPYSLTEDDILPGFSAALSFSGVTVPLEAGQNLVNPAFTAVYNRLAAAASLSDGVDGYSLTLPATSFGYNSGPLPAKTYVKTVPGQTVTFTLTANETGGPSKTSAVTETWLSRAYYGIAVPGTYNEAFIEALSGSALKTSLANTIAYTGMDGSQKLYYAFLASFGAPVSFKDQVTGFGIPFTKVGSAVSVTNTYGVTLSIDLWESDNFLVSDVTVVIV